MTLMEVMDDLADFLRRVVSEYSAKQKAGAVPIAVYAGYPPVRSSAKETASCIYALVTDFTDGEDDMSTARVEIGFSIYDDDEEEGWRSLMNIMEHVRQALLMHPCLARRSVIVRPVKGEITGDQPFPQWQGKITADYAIGQPTEEGINYDRF